MHVRVSLIIVAFTTMAANALANDQSWPAFRGNGTSVASAMPLPLKWSNDSNISWKSDIRGYGQSSPVVYGNKCFVTSVEGESKETLIVACIDVESGNQLWEKQFPASQTVKSSNYVSKAAPTPVVDANRLYAFFESGDIFALSHDGELKWKRSLTDEYGKYEGNHGLGASPALTDSSVVLLVDHDGPSYLIALDKDSGKNLWKVDRKSRISWSSPIVVEGASGAEVIISSNGTAEAYRVSDGRQMWQVDGLQKNTVASPTVTGDLVIIGSSNQRFNWAVRRGGEGNVTETHVAWKSKDVTSSFGSPLAYGEYTYFVNRSGVAFCVELSTGKLVKKHRLPGSCWASPIAAGDRIYFFTKKGATTVLSADGQLTELATNELGADGTTYGVAVADGAFLVRTGSQLLKIKDAGN